MVDEQRKSIQFGSDNSVEMIDKAMMEETIPRLAVAMQSMLAGAIIQVLGQQQIDIHFDGIPAWKISVVRKLVNNRNQMIESRIDLLPACLSELSMPLMQKLAAAENFGLRGVTVVPIQPDPDSERGGLRVRAAFIGQKGRTIDESENLAIDILNVVAFARTLEDRVTENSVAGKFSMELYESKQNRFQTEAALRIVSNSHGIFIGSDERVFAEVKKAMLDDLSFQIRDTGLRAATVCPPGSKLEILVKIPDNSQLFIASAPLMKLDDMSDEQIFSLLEELNSQGESGHYEVNLHDRILSYSSWKHLTNDLRHYSFDHTIFSVHRAHAMAAESIFGAPVLPGVAA